MSKRLEILKKSLEKKESVLTQKFDNHFADVKRGNGQPMNDKRNGRATLNRWEKQNDAIRNQQKEIERTKRAIEFEEGKIKDCEEVKQRLPISILNALESGELTQWRKFPNRFFVKNGGGARICFKDNDFHYSHLAKCNESERKIFAECYNRLRNEFKNNQNN